jgi:hypothetical protein
MNQAADRQTALYKDRFWCYRANPLAARDDTGTIDKYLPVSTVQNQPCKNFTTTNYSESASPVGLQGQDNFLTADKLHFDRTLDVQSDDIVKVQREGGVPVEWFTVAGDKYARYRSNKASVLLRTTSKPVGLT